MSLSVCAGCGCRFAVGLLRCPQCQAVSPQFADRMQETEEEMARITVGGGVSDATAAPGQPGYIEPAAEEATASVAAPVAETPEVPADPAPAPAEPAAPAAEDPARPALNARRAAWNDYQVARGLDADAADGMTKAELQAWEPDAAAVTALQVTAEAEVTRGAP